jgi:hypothetical protein
VPFGAQKVVAISGPKKVSIFRAHPFQGPLEMDVAHIKMFPPSDTLIVIM